MEDRKGIERPGQGWVTTRSCAVDIIGVAENEEGKEVSDNVSDEESEVEKRLLNAETDNNDENIDRVEKEKVRNILSIYNRQIKVNY